MEKVLSFVAKTRVSIFPRIFPDSWEVSGFGIYLASNQAKNIKRGLTTIIKFLNHSVSVKYVT